MRTNLQDTLKRIGATLFFLGCGSLGRADEPGPQTCLIFVAIYKATTGVCSEAQIVTNETRVVEGRPDELQSSLRAEVMKHYQSAYNTYIVRVLPPTQAAIVFRATWKPSDCESKLISVATGATIAMAESEMVANAKNNDWTLGAVIRRWPDTPPASGSYKREFTRSYDGVEIKFTAASFASGKTVVLAQATNKRKDAAASLTLRDQSGAGTTSADIKPNERVTLKLETTDGFDVDLQFSAADSSGNDRGLIDALKELVRTRVLTKDGKMMEKPTETAVGTRG